MVHPPTTLRGLRVLRCRVYFGELFSLLRIVDDGAVVSTDFCKACSKLALHHMWGRDQTIFEEEEGQIIRLEDMLDVIEGGEIFLEPYYHAFPVGPALSPPKPRSVPTIYQPHPRHCRLLFLYIIHRVGQISRCDRREAERAILEMAYSLHHPPICYTWDSSALGHPCSEKES